MRRTRTVVWLDVAGLLTVVVLAVFLVLRILAGLPHH